MSSSFPLKLHEDDEVENQALEPKLGLVGSCTRQGEHGHAILAWKGSQTKQGEREGEKGTFLQERRGEPW